MLRELGLAYIIVNSNDVEAKLKRALEDSEGNLTGCVNPCISGVSGGKHNLVLFCLLRCRVSSLDVGEQGSRS